MQKIISVLNDGNIDSDDDSNNEERSFVEVRTVLLSRCVCVTGVKCRVEMDMKLR